MNPHLLLHLHIPKTAGVSFYEMCRRHLGEGVLQLNDLHDLRHIVTTGAAEPQDIRVVSGHFPYGIDRLFGRKCAYMTVLRDPVERTISNFYYIRRRAGHPAQKLYASMSLEEFSRSTEYELDNTQVRRLLRGSFADPSWPNALPFGAIGADEFAEAKYNLANCAVAGTVERFKETVQLATALFDLNLPRKVIHINVGKSPKMSRIKRSIIQRIEDRNQLDIELYRQADAQLTAAMTALSKKAPADGNAPEGTRSMAQASG